MDSDRLLVARFVLKADLNEIAGFQHLPGGLGKAGLVAVDGRDRGEPGGIQGETEEYQQRNTASVI